jgi:hypothetical protein
VNALAPFSAPYPESEQKSAELDSMCLWENLNTVTVDAYYHIVRRDHE